VAREQGITEQEIGAIQGLAMAVAAGKINGLMRDFAPEAID
jgi:hypothetical protein